MTMDGKDAIIPAPVIEKGFIKGAARFIEEGGEFICRYYFE